VPNNTPTNKKAWFFNLEKLLNKKENKIKGKQNIKPSLICKLNVYRAVLTGKGKILPKNKQNKIIPIKITGRFNFRIAPLLINTFSTPNTQFNQNEAG